MINRKQTMTLIGLLLIAGIGLKSQAADGYIDKPGGYDFTSKGISCKINPSGHISDIYFKDKKIFEYIQMFAIVKLKGLEKKSRLYQSNSRAKLLQVNSTPAETSIICEGFLAVGNNENFATFRQITSVSENKIHIDNEVVTTKEITVKRWFSFTTFIVSAVKDLINSEVKVINTEGEIKSFPFPPVYSKENGFYQNKLTNCKFTWSTLGCDLSLDGNKNTEMGINDARAWQKENLNIQIKPKLKSDSDKLLCPVGTKITWSFTITFENQK